MDTAEWSATVAALSSRDTDEACRAAARLHQEALVEDVPKLLFLLENDDFFIREAAAWPLAELAGPAVLEHLLLAYQRGFDQGWDNDGFTAALLEIPALHPGTANELRKLIASPIENIRVNAEWLLTFCETGM